MLSKDKIQEINRKMLEFGSPNRKDGVGYTNPHWSVMERYGRYQKELDDYSTFRMLSVLMKYRKRQLWSYKEEIESTFLHYKAMMLPETTLPTSLQEYLPRALSYVGSSEDKNFGRVIELSSVTKEGYGLSNAFFDYKKTGSGKQPQNIIISKDRTGVSMKVNPLVLSDFLNDIRNFGRYGYAPDDTLKMFLRTEFLAIKQQCEEFLENKEKLPADAIENEIAETGLLDFYKFTRAACAGDGIQNDSTSVWVTVEDARCTVPIRDIPGLDETVSLDAPRYLEEHTDSEAWMSLYEQYLNQKDKNEWYMWKIPKCRSTKVGDRYNSLVVRAFFPRKPGTPVRVLVKCDCGKLKEIQLGNLRFRSTKSCGCQYKKSTDVNGVICMKRKKGNKYLAYTFFHGSRYDLGTFSTLEDAVLAKEEAEQKKQNNSFDINAFKKAKVTRGKSSNKDF